MDLAESDIKVFLTERSAEILQLILPIPSPGGPTYSQYRPAQDTSWTGVHISLAWVTQVVSCIWSSVMGQAGQTMMSSLARTVQAKLVFYVQYSQAGV